MSAATLTPEAPAYNPCRVPFKVLQRFTNPDKPVLASVLSMGHYRGDLTESGDQRRRLEMGDERYAHYHWDTVATTGRIFLCVPRCKHPEAVAQERGAGITPPAEWFWIFGQIEIGRDTFPAGPKTVARIPDELLEDLRVLPGLEFVEVERVHFYTDNKPKHRPPPRDLVFFRFTGGQGCVVAFASEKEKREAAKPHPEGVAQ